MTAAANASGGGHARGEPGMTAARQAPQRVTTYTARSYWYRLYFVIRLTSFVVYSGSVA